MQISEIGRCTSCVTTGTCLKVREVHLLIQQLGVRPSEIILVTTKVYPKRYPKAKLAQLYQQRKASN